MIKFFSDILTEKDGETYCIGRVLWIIGVVGFIALTAYAVLHGKDFNPRDYGIGLGSALGGGGIGVAAKGKNE